LSRQLDLDSRSLQRRVQYLATESVARMPICVTGAACDHQACGSYTPTDAECVAGRALPCVPTPVTIPTTMRTLP
jgi:hypothetical protein